MTYLRYCDRDSTATELLAGACARYVERTGRLPQVAYINSDDAGGLAPVDGLTIYPMRYVAPGSVVVGAVSRDD